MGTWAGSDIVTVGLWAWHGTDQLSLRQAPGGGNGRPSAGYGCGAGNAGLGAGENERGKQLEQSARGCGGEGGEG